MTSPLSLDDAERNWIEAANKAFNRSCHDDRGFSPQDFSQQEARP